MKKKAQVFLIDFPAKQDEGLPTESDVVRAILKHRDKLVEHEKFATKSEFDDYAWAALPNVRYVHLGGHGGKKGMYTKKKVAGLGPGRNRITWDDIAAKLKIVAPRLKPGQERVLVLSCCYSKFGFEAVRKSLRHHFTRCYRLRQTTVDFSAAVVVWAMFYERKNIDGPHEKIVRRINRLFTTKIKKTKLTNKDKERHLPQLAYNKF